MRPECRERPAGNQAFSDVSFDGDTDRLPETVDALTHLQHRVVQEALAVGLKSAWLRRAVMFEWARPLPGEFTGRATREDLSRRWRELTAIAAACRARAALASPDNTVITTAISTAMDMEVAS